LISFWQEGIELLCKRPHVAGLHVKSPRSFEVYYKSFTGSHHSEHSISCTRDVVLHSSWKRYDVAIVHDKFFSGFQIFFENTTEAAHKHASLSTFINSISNF
jgi:hypothetical protein